MGPIANIVTHSVTVLDADHGIIVEINDRIPFSLAPLELTQGPHFENHCCGLAGSSIAPWTGRGRRLIPFIRTIDWTRGSVTKGESLTALWATVSDLLHVACRQAASSCSYAVIMWLCVRSCLKKICRLSLWDSLITVGSCHPDLQAETTIS